MNLCFAGDPHRPTRPPLWQDALQSVKASLGLAPGPIPFCADIILEAAGRELFQTPPLAIAAPAVFAGIATANKEWRFLRSERLGRQQFLAFANARGSSSLRFFDAESGALMGEPRYGKGRTFQRGVRERTGGKRASLRATRSVVRRDSAGAACVRCGSR